jgi:hypothetical protein
VSRREQKFICENQTNQICIDNEEKNPFAEDDKRWSSETELVSGIERIPGLFLNSEEPLQIVMLK